MLLFSSGTFTIDGVTVFPDHSDPKQYWYLPGPVNLETQANSSDPQFNLIMYAPDVASAGIQGNGFLMATVCLKLNRTTQSKIVSQIQSLHPEIDSPLLSPVYFDEGTVQVVSLNAQGSGGTTAAAGPGVAIQQILGATTPDFFGNNDAVFDLVLTEEGATILKAAFTNGMTPVGAIYSMKFSGMQPALDVKITCDMKRAYQSFSASLTGSIYCVSAGIDATFEKLRQDGSIKVEIVSMINDASTQAQEQWALNLFKDQIMSQWFTPSLSPTTEAAADAQNMNINPAGGGGTHPSTPTTTTTTSTQNRTPSTMGGGTGSSQMGSSSSSGQGMSSSSGNAQASQAGQHPTAGMTTPAAGAQTPAATSNTAAQTTPAPASTGAASSTTTAQQGAPPAAGSGSSSTTTTTQPAQPSTGAAAANAIAKAAGTAAAASSAASPFGVALRLKYVNQDELKTVEIEFNQESCVQRTYAPQGYFGLLLAGLDQSKFFLQVDGNNPFFTTFAVTLNPPRDFNGIGLLNLHTALDYGIASDPTSPAPKHGEFNFDPSNMAPQVWDVFEGNIQSNQYNYAVDYTFDPNAGWDGDQLHYQLPAVTTENRTVILDPNTFLRFLRLNVVADRIDSNFVDRVEVALSFTSAAGWNTTQIMVVHPGNAPQSWKIRALADPADPTAALSYTWTPTCYLKDGTIIPGKTQRSSSTTLMVNDPFVGSLEIVLQPAFASAVWQFVYVTVSYQDAGANFNSNTTVQLIPGAAAAHVHIPILSKLNAQFQYQITALSASGQQIQYAPVTTGNTVVLVGPVQS